jgi:hypothetical protein
VAYSLGKGKIGNSVSIKALQTSFVPGVGSYPKLEELSSLANHLNGKKPVINHYNFKRFSEAVAQTNSWVPGPGIYNIGPLPKISKSSSVPKSLKLSKIKSIDSI